MINFVIDREQYINLYTIDVKNIPGKIKKLKNVKKCSKNKKTFKNVE